MIRRHDRPTHFALAIAIAALAACDDGGDPAAVGDDIETSNSPLSDASQQELDGVPEIDDSAEDVEEAEVLYPGNVCEGDQQCSTGLCYGIATPQGFFEAPRCQPLCLPLSDFGRYCDSDDDCCKGNCCLGCGPREGLCVLD